MVIVRGVSVVFKKHPFYEGFPTMGVYHAVSVKPYDVAPPEVEVYWGLIKSDKSHFVRVSLPNISPDKTAEAGRKIRDYLQGN
jgi:hypothetical protein